jgi:serine protease AprX
MMKKFALILFLLVPVLIFADSGRRQIEKLYDADGNRIFENLQDRLAKATRDTLIPVIVTYRDDTPMAGTLSARLPKIEQLKYSYHNIRAVAASMTPDEIRESLKDDPYIQQIELDSRVYAAMNTARPSFGVDALRTQFHFTGDGDGIRKNFSKNDIVICILDSGINANHPDLQHKVLFWKDFVNGRTSPYDDNGHGTVVAGVAAGAGKLKPKFRGVAPEASLVVMKVLDKDGSGPVSNAISAIDLAIDLKTEFHIRVLNLSLAVPGNSAGKDAFSTAANRAVAAGIVVVVAAGNEGPTDHTIGAPSAAARVITVGAGADTGERGFYLAGFSSRGPTADGRIKPDLWGPGVKIESTSRSGGYTTLSGTSFATPFVAGVVALMLQANPLLKPAGVKSILMRTAERWAPGKKNSDSGAGRLRAYEAVTRAAAITSDLKPPVGPTLFFVKSSINSGEVHNFQIPVDRTKDCIAITAIIYNAPGPGVLLELLSPAGVVVTRQDQFNRQETLTYKPSVTGTYTLRVTGFGGSSPYLIDVSADQN